MSEYLPLMARWEDRQAVYTPDGLPVIWDRALLPLPVHVADLPAALADAMIEGARMWNREVGFAVFMVTPDVTRARVLIESGSANDGGLAATTHSGDVLPEAATVELRQVGSVSECLWVATHELGHVLGLRDAQQGCMGDMPEGFDSSRHYCLPRAEEIDYLRAVYHR